MLKHVHDLKKDLREKGWRERENPEVSQTSFLRSEDSDAQLGFTFEWYYLTDIAHFILISDSIFLRVLSDIIYSIHYIICPRYHRFEIIFYQWFQFFMGIVLDDALKSRYTSWSP